MRVEVSRVFPFPSVLFFSFRVVVGGIGVCLGIGESSRILSGTWSYPDGQLVSYHYGGDH